MSTEQARQDAAARLRQRRVLLGLSLAAVAENAGIDPAVLDDVEHGRVDTSREVLQRLALFYNVLVEDLLHGDPAVPEPPQATCVHGRLTADDREKLVLFALGLRRRARLGNPPPRYPAVEQAAQFSPPLMPQKEMR